MFQRIARRHPDRADEAGAAESAADGAETAAPPPNGAAAPAPDAAAPDGPAPEAADAAAPADTPTGALPPVDAPTERIEPVTPAAPPPIVQLGEQPTTYQPAVPAAEQTTLAPGTATAAAGAAAGTPAETPAGEGATPTAEAPAAEAATAEPAPRRPGFRARGRMRRRLRYLRRLREIQVRDLGGLVFDLRRFERKRDDLVAQKIDHIRACDDELRALETALGERRDLRDVHEPGIGGTCPRCFAVYGSADRFCSNCGVALGGAVQGPAQVAPAPPPQASTPGS